MKVKRVTIQVEVPLEVSADDVLDLMREQLNDHWPAVQHQEQVVSESETTTTQIGDSSSEEML